MNEQTLVAVGGGCLGIILALIYTFYAWYSNDAVQSSVGKTTRFRALIFLLGPGGGVVALHWFAPSTAWFDLWCGTTCYAAIVVLIISIFFQGMICGFSARINDPHKFTTSLRYGYKCAFEGWKSLNNVLENDDLALHMQSKLALAKLALDISELPDYARSIGSNHGTFIRLFKSTTAYALYSFFQHSTDKHPDYCACYFKWIPATRDLQVAASVSGSDGYAMNDRRILKEGSIAYRALADGKIYVWPACKEELKLRRLDPPLRRGINRFIVVPVYRTAIGTPHHSEEQWLGVLSVDSAKPGFHFSDQYHTDILKVIAACLGELDQSLLTGFTATPP